MKSPFGITLLCFFLAFLSSQSNVFGLPLRTDSRWIVDENGSRVKLACVNWVAHLEPVVAEGLSKQPLGAIAQKIRHMGFNCVRFTWPLFLATNESLASLTVRQSFQGIGLYESIAGVQANNPSILDLSLIDAFKVELQKFGISQGLLSAFLEPGVSPATTSLSFETWAVVSGLADNNVMVILDNHLSKPGWCCSTTDGNGFFGDQYFSPDLWLQGLSKMATLFKDQPYVVGMSLRNELRGPRQNVNDWYRYMKKGAEAVHSANPEVLVIVSGLTFDTDLSFLHKQPLSLTFSDKLVFEVHWYAFSDFQAWEEGNLNQVCGSVGHNVTRRAGFLLDEGFPLMVSEFGKDLRGGNVNDNRYFSCFLAYAADHDFDWALWTLVGSHYFRSGEFGVEEVYAVLDYNWCGIRNATFMQRISAIQPPLKGPGVSGGDPHKMIFHPATGLCVLRNSSSNSLFLGPCSDTEPWSYTPDKTLTIEGTNLCLQSDGPDNAAKMASDCTDAGSTWDPISDSKLHLSTKLGGGSTVCLDADAGGEIITSPCSCLSKDKECDPEFQWFKIVETAKGSSSGSGSSLVNLVAGGLRE